jgi:hypothetical protein
MALALGFMKEMAGLLSFPTLKSKILILFCR